MTNDKWKMARFLPAPASCRLPDASCLLLLPLPLPPACSCLLPSASCLPPPACSCPCLLPAPAPASCLLPPTVCPLPTAHCHDKLSNLCSKIFWHFCFV
jgi:hypothetical protein